MDPGYFAFQFFLLIDHDDSCIRFLKRDAQTAAVLTVSSKAP